MTEKEYKQCISDALCTEYNAMLLDNPVKHDFSHTFEIEMDKLIKRRKKPYYTFINTVGKRAAVIILAVVVASFSTIMSVEALRKPFLDFTKNMFTTHTEIRSAPDDSKEYPKTIKNKYDITEGINGYSRDVLRDKNTEVSLHYSQGDNLIEFEQHIVDGFDIYANTEGATIEHIDINGHDAIGWFDNHNYYHLIWNNGEYVIEISSTIGKDKLIEVAKSVQKVE